MEGTIIENSLQNATVEIVKLINNSDQRNDLYSEMRIWDLYIPNQFPVMNVEQHGNKVVLTTANPHEHYTIHAKFVNNKLEGKAILKTPQDEVIARFSYSAGEMSGFCKIYYKSGKLFYKGYLLNGYRHGKGKEYDENGDITFDGYFKNGSANPYLKRVTNMKDYWRETDISGNVVFVGRKDNYGRNIGYCYLFESGSLKSESFFQHGKELFRSKLFINEIMLEYNNNVVTYNGTYHGSIETGFERRCGIEYDKTGQRKVYNGDFVKGKHVGYGVSYDINNQIKYNGEWIYGMSLKTFNTICITLPIIFELCLTVYTFFIFIPMYQCILSFVILLISLILYHYIRKAWLLCPLTSDFVPRTGEMPHQYNDKAVISSNMFKSVKEFRIDGLRNLNKLEIMNYSFTKAKPKENKNTKLIFDNEKSFHILNCESLESIKIGKFSFSDFAGDFELKNLPALQSIQIGTIGSNDLCNFYCSSFVIRDLPNLQSITLGDYAFCGSLLTVIENLPSLQSITLGEWALAGRDDESCSLTMRNLFSLMEMYSDNGRNFYYIRSVKFENLPIVSAINLPWSFAFFKNIDFDNISKNLEEFLHSKIALSSVEDKALEK